MQFMQRLVPWGNGLLLVAQLTLLSMNRAPWLPPDSHAAVAVADDSQGQVSVGELDQQESSPVSEKEWHSARKSIRKATRLFESIDDIEGRFQKQERWGKFLEEPATLEFRQLVQPLCIYLKWEAPHTGREVLYRQDLDAEKVIVLESTPLGKLAPTFVLSHDHKLAKQVSRYSIDELNLAGFMTRIRRYFGKGQRDPNTQLAVVESVDIDGVDCRRISILHPRQGKTAPRDYHQVELYFRNSDGLPIRWEKYGWPGTFDSDEPPLIEFFKLSDVQLNRGRSTEDFDADHAEFGFSRIHVPLQ